MVSARDDASAAAVLLPFPVNRRHMYVHTRCQRDHNRVPERSRAPAQARALAKPRASQKARNIAAKKVTVQVSAGLGMLKRHGLNILRCARADAVASRRARFLEGGLTMKHPNHHLKACFNL